MFDIAMIKDNILLDFIMRIIISKIMVKPIDYFFNYKINQACFLDLQQTETVVRSGCPVA